MLGEYKVDFLRCYLHLFSYSPGIRLVIIKQKGVKMEYLKIIGKKVLVILAICAAIIGIGLAGQLDADEYIEATSTPKTRMPLYYEK